MTYILEFIHETCWAILPTKLAAIVEVAQRHAAGERLAPEIVAEIAAAANGRQAPQARGTVAVLPIVGTIIPRGDMLAESSGAVSTQRIAANLRAALADPGVSAIVLDVDSPGGSVFGVAELADEIYRARAVKPVVAVADYLAASAGYYLASAASELWVAPTGEVGSIGVFAMHADYSRAVDQKGITVSLISAGKYKTEGSPYAPLGEEARAAMQARVDDYYGAFVKAVARHRDTSAADVRGGFGEGRVVGAAEAVKLGMADHIGTLEDAIARAAKLARTAPAGPLAAVPDDRDYRQRRARAITHWDEAGSVEPGGTTAPSSGA